MRRLTAGGISLFAMTWAMTWAGSALALGLGEIDVRSHLNQGFSAVVPVLGAADEELDSLNVQVADNDEFVRAGIDRNDYLSTLRFAVAKAADGTPVLKIRSNELAREPFLRFVVEARWSGGRLVREYTALLDPQVTDLTPAAPAAAAQSSAAQPSAAVAPAGRAPQPASPAKQKPLPVPATAAESAAGSYGPVAPNETLWSIATRLQQDLGGTVDQVLLALYRKNPTAFEGGSIDRVMKGMTLATPSQAELNAADPAAAHRKVAELRGLVPAASAAKPVPAAAKPEPLKPEPAKPEAAAPPPAAPDSAQPAPVFGAATTPAATASPAVGEAAVDAGAQAPAAPATAAPEPAPPPAVVPTPAPAVPAAGGAGELLMPVLAGLAALLLGALGLIVLRRRRAAAEAAEGAAPFAGLPELGLPVKEESRDVLLEPAAAETAAPFPPIPAAPVTKPEPEASPETPLLPAAAPGFEQAKAEQAPALSAAPDASDPLADADFHLSYGLHEEAASILKSALLEEPSRIDLKRKLADVYFAGRRGLEFQELAEQLRTQVDTAEWKHIVEQGRQLVPNAAIFKPTLSAQPFGALPDIDLDEFDLSGDAASHPAAAPAPTPAPVPAAVPAAPPAAAAPLAFDINSLDLASGSDGKPDRIEFNLDELDLAQHEDGEPSFALGDDFDTKLDLARAYADMGDSEAALNLLSEVAAGGSDKQKAEARSLQERLSG